MPFLSEKNNRIVHHIFESGIALLIFWLLVITVLSLFNNSTAPKLFTMILTHLVSGRAGGISVGLELELAQWLIILNATLIDSIVVLILYPLFIFSYNHTVKKGIFSAIIQKSAIAAETNRDKVSKFGVVGLLLFVWFPLHMTGPLAGSILGFLLGISPLKTISIVLSGTFLAVVSWLLIFRKAFEFTEGFTLIIPVSIVLFSGILYVFYRIKSKSGKE